MKRLRRLGWLTCSFLSAALSISCLWLWVRPRFLAVRPTDPLTPVTVGVNSGYLSPSLEMVVPPDYGEATRSYPDGHARARIGPEVFLFHPDGRIALRTDLNVLGEFDDQGMAFVLQHSGKWGWIDRQGRQLIPFLYDQTWGFDSYGWAAVSRDGKWGWIDRNGREVLPFQWNYVSSFDRNDLARLSQNGKYGWIDRSGRQVLPLQWMDARDFDSQGMAAVAMEFEVDVPNRSGLDRSWGQVNREPRWGAIDRTGKLVVPLRFEYPLTFNASGLAPASVRGKFGLVDRTGKEVVPPRWDRAPFFGKGRYATAIENQRTGLIDQSGRSVLPAEWDSLSIPDSLGSMVASKDRMWGCIDVEGRVLIPFEWQSLTPTESPNHYVGRKGGRKHLLDRSGRSLLDFGEGNWDAFPWGGVLALERHPWQEIPWMKRLLEALPPMIRQPFNGLTIVYDSDLRPIWRSDAYFFRPAFFPCAGLFGLMSVFCTWRWRRSAESIKKSRA